MGEADARVRRAAIDPPVRPAATVILVRDPAGAPQVLMGQRGKAAAFMPGKFVFPGGAVDEADAAVPLAEPLPEPCATLLADEAAGVTPAAIAAAAIRELWEETGLVLGNPGAWAPPPGWEGFAATGNAPAAGALRFVFRAVTPPGRPRRFDARFLLADAAAIAGDPDDFSAASDELAHLQWIPLDRVRGFDLPFITQVVLAEVAGRLPALEPPATVPYFANTEEASLFRRLGGRAL